MKVKEVLSTHAGARRLFVQGMLLKRRAANRERGLGTGNGKAISENKTENWKGSY